MNLKYIPSALFFTSAGLQFGFLVQREPLLMISATLLLLAGLCYLKND